MHWDRLFDDLEGQFASEWEAERAALDAEAERLRISRLDLRDRLRMLCAANAQATIDLPDIRSGVRLRTLGADWIAASALVSEGTLAPMSIQIIPLHAIRGISADHSVLLRSLEEHDERTPALRERMTLGFVLRDFARRRTQVRVSTEAGNHLYGTIDRAGSDHFDLAQHDRGTARRAGAVQGFRIIPFAALVGVELPGDQLP